MKKAIADHDDAMRSEMGNLLELTQRGFAVMFQIEQSSIDSHCPNVFVLRPSDDTSRLWDRIVGQKVELQLYCQAPGCWHPYGEPYRINRPANWIRATAPYLQKLVSVLKYAAPLAGPWVAVSFPEYEKMFKNDLKLMTELVKKLPDIKAERDLGMAEEIGEMGDPRRVEGADLRVVRQLLHELDPNQRWGGLKKVLTPEGHYLWLCEHHAKEYAK